MHRQIFNVWRLGASFCLLLFAILTTPTQEYGFDVWTTENGLPQNTVTGVVQTPDGYLWLATFDGLARFDGVRFTIFDKGNTKGIVNNRFLGIFADKEGAVWAWTENGVLTIYRGGVFSSFSTPEGLRESIANILADADGNPLIETKEQYYYLQDGKFVAASEQKKPGARLIYYGKSGAKWIDGKFFNYRVEHGLFNNGVFAILEDNRGNFWMSSNRGIHRVSKQELNDFADGKIPKLNSISYDEKDGMLNAECNGGRIPSAIKTKDGKLWFPTMGGVAIIDPEAEEINPNAPPVVIENVAVDRKPIETNLFQSAIQTPQSAIEMLPAQTNLEINYTGLSLIKSRQIKFKYRLEGFEENWVEAGTARAANYSYLPPGEYVFHVIAANSDGVWNNDGAKLRVIVRPYFYQTWWFRVLAALAVALIIGLIYYNRVSHLKEIAATKTEFSRQLIESQEAERKRIATELHDGLGQSLAIISNRAMMGKSKKDEPEFVAKEFNEISQNALDGLNEVQEITNALHPHYLARLGLTKALKAMFQKLEGVIEFEYEIDVIDDIFPKNAEINVYRIIQEAFNNIIKHSEAAEAVVKIKKFENEVSITVKDDGRGFDPNNVKSGGLGLVGLKERINMLGGRISIISSLGNGTEIKIVLPIKI